MENKCKTNPWNSIVFRMGVLFIVFLTAVGVIASWHDAPATIPFILVISAAAVLYLHKKFSGSDC